MPQISKFEINDKTDFESEYNCPELSFFSIFNEITDKKRYLSCIKQ